MCLLFFVVNTNAGPNEYKLILVNNRDELYSRPTEYAHVWDTEPKIIAGKDGESGRVGGTWLCISERSKIGCLLNVLQAKGSVRTDVTGRGFLALEFLKNSSSAIDYVQGIKESNIQYNLFNLVLFEMKDNKYQALYYSNLDQGVHPLESDKVQGFGNCYFEKPFNKVEKGKEIFHKIVNQYRTTSGKNALIKSLMEMMHAEEKHFPDERLVQQGKGHTEDHLRTLSSIWVTIPQINYGTRTTTVILVDGNNHLSYYERSMEKPSANCQDFSKAEFDMELISI